MLYYLLFVTLFGMYRILVADYGVPRTLEPSIRSKLKYRPTWKAILLNPFELFLLIIVGFLNGAGWLIVPVKFLIFRSKFWSKEFFLCKDHDSAFMFVMVNVDLLDYKHIMKLAAIHEFDDIEMDEIENSYSELKDSKKRR